MDTLEILFFLVIGFGAVALAVILVAKPVIGNAAIAGGLCAIFSGYTAVQIAREGVVMFFTNHSGNLTGLQVWWDLIMCWLIALFFIAPRARNAGMNVVPWALLVATTASIGLLAMCARLFWLEAQAQVQAQVQAKRAPG